MRYPGLELESFDKAHIWRKYIFFLTKKYFKNEMLEVGAGIGSFTHNYLNKFNKIALTETDENNFKRLKIKFEKNLNIKIFNNLVANVPGKFNTIIYLNVLEHIEDDINEINKAAEKLNQNGYLIILVPAHQKLFNKFDKAVGHFRRYELNFFKNNTFNNLKLIDLYHLDFFGYFLYFINQIFFKEEVYPTKLKIFLWDKIFTPITIIFDFLLNYKFGKNIICVYKKE